MHSRVYTSLNPALLQKTDVYKEDYAQLYREHVASLVPHPIDFPKEEASTVGMIRANLLIKL